MESDSVRNNISLHFFSIRISIAFDGKNYCSGRKWCVPKFALKEDRAHLHFQKNKVLRKDYYRLCSIQQGMKMTIINNIIALCMR